MMYEMQITCRILVLNQYAFLFFYQTLYLRKMVCFLKSWKESVKTNVQWDSSLIEGLFWINNWLVIFAKTEILSKQSAVALDLILRISCRNKIEINPVAGTTLKWTNIVTSSHMSMSKETSVATWQNQQSECAPSEDSGQPGHPPSLIRVFAVRMKKPLALSYSLSAQWRLWSDWAGAEADLSLRWAHTHYVGFVMSRLMLWPHCFVCPAFCPNKCQTNVSFFWIVWWIHPNSTRQVVDVR